MACQHECLNCSETHGRPGLPSQYLFPLAFPGNTRLGGEARTLIIISNKGPTLIGIRESCAVTFHSVQKCISWDHGSLARCSVWFIEPNGPQLSEEHGEVTVSESTLLALMRKPSGSIVSFPHCPWVTTQSLSPCPAYVTIRASRVPYREGLVLLF